MSEVAAPGRLGRSRPLLPLIALGLLLAVVVYYSRDSWLLVFEGIFIEGVIGLLWLSSAALLGDLIAARLNAPFLLRWCTAAGLGLGFFSLATLAMGLAGILSFYSCIALLVISAAAGIADFFISKKTVGFQPTQSADFKWNWLLLLLVPFAAIALVGVNVAPGVLWWPNDPHPYDVLGYHLQLPREWFELGRITPLHHNMYSFFPLAAEMNYLLGMYIHGGPWAGMYLAQTMSFSYMVLAILTVASAMPTRPAGVIAALAMGLVPWNTQLAAIAYNESALLLYVALAAAWMIRALGDRTHLIRCMTIAGIVSGLACGVKYTAAPIILVGFAITSLGVLITVCSSEWKRIMLGAGVFAASGLLTFSPWLIRNAIWGGNPVFPLAMRQLGHAHFTPEQVERFDRAHRAVPHSSSLGARLSAFKSEVLTDWRFGWFLIPMAVVSGILNFRRPEALFLSINILIMSLFWIFMTHLMGRFFVPAIPVLAMLAGYLALTPRAVVFNVIALGLMSVAAMAHLHKAFLFSMEQRKGAGYLLIRLPDFSPLWPPQLVDIEKTSAKLALIGDAQAFYRPLPMSRLEYRTIFDVVVPPGKNIVDAWLGRDLDELRKDHYIILNPGELNRLSRTYYGIPPVPPQWAEQGDQTIILTPTRP